jgi:hypothetical protein
VHNDISSVHWTMARAIASAALSEKGLGARFVRDCVVWVAHSESRPGCYRAAENCLNIRGGRAAPIGFIRLYSALFAFLWGRFFCMVRICARGEGGKNVSGETPNTACETHALPNPKL